MFKRIQGTKDILPDEILLWQKIEEISRKVFSCYNYLEIRPPLIEEAGLFDRSLGVSSEIIQKQMFVIKNKEGLYALRPEGTASVVRAFIENNLDKTTGFSKFYYIGPMFRLERPQRGRLRQFNHIGCEAIGSMHPDLDVEVISLADSLLTAYKISGYKIKLNNLGCAEDKKKLGSYLSKELTGKLANLCEDCKARFGNNILRILDCKNESCRQIVGELKIADSHICDSCKGDFSRVKEGLDLLGVKYEFSPLLVRGLDYYTGTVFEISHPDLGAQDAICAGGRYNNLVKELGGRDSGAAGFAFGVERLLLAGVKLGESDKPGITFIITLGDDARKEGLKLLNLLRRNDIAAETDYEAKSLKGAMRHANDLKAGFAVILGEDELKKGVVTLKDMNSGEQREIRQADLISNIKK